jgi:predicted unusual protein kinase regulating ubiquinone biosynthesis (AarF/ABC1/UbiB family)
MKEQNSIPVSKVERAVKFVSTGAKIGGNYIKHYAKKVVDPELSKDALHEDNATDIYNTLSQLKGSALKVAQMLSQDKNMLPSAYVDKFQLAQYSAPPLSYPLVVKTFKQFFNKRPEEIFTTFSTSAIHAASIGQVHRATLGDKVFAVKIQYPGVADAVSSDLKMVRPFAVRLMNMNDRDIEEYMEEVETKLLEETDYELELHRGKWISEACRHINGLNFPSYYPDYSSKRILTMDWLEGFHIKEFMATEPSQEIRNRVGQLLWDFYDYQIHQLRAVHADPHPGNFIVQSNGDVGVIDFGCVKEIPDDYYQAYFQLIKKETIHDKALLWRTFEALDFFDINDTQVQKEIFFDLFYQMTNLLGRPFYTNEFDFGNETYFNEIYSFGESITSIKEIKNAKQARGSKHGIYINRTYFGLYSILHQLKAVVKTNSYGKATTDVNS